MKKNTLLFVLIFTMISCKKDTALVSPETGEGEIIWLGGQNSTLPFDSIVSPPPTKTEYGEIYHFDLYPGAFANDDELTIRNVRTDDTIDDVLHSTRHITINVDYTLSDNDTYEVFHSQNSFGDSMAIVTEYAFYKSFDSTYYISTHTISHPKAFFRGDRIDLNQVNWIADHDLGVPYFTHGGTVYGRQLILDESPTYPNYSFTVQDLFYPLLQGTEHFIVVFKTKSNQGGLNFEQRFGWVEMSIDEDANLTVHRVVYQID